MAPSIDEINALLTQSYSPEMIPKLEEFLEAQFTGKANYHFDANRTLIKLYQLFTKHSEDKIEKVCLLGLSNFPSTDLLAISYMIPAHMLKRDKLAKISDAYRLLDACKFQEFWAVQGLTVDVPKIQNGIIGVLALSYKQAPLNVVTLAINSTEQNLIKKHPAVESVSDSGVVFASTSDNTHRERVYQEGVNFSSINALMSKISQ